MSIHAQISHEAAAALAAQRRNSTIASILIGILLVVLLGLVFWLIGISIFSKKVEAIVAYSEEAVVEDTIEKVKVKNSVKKKPSSQSSSAVPLIIAKAKSNFALPEIEITTDTLSPDFGTDEGFGDGIGEGAFGGFGPGGGEGKFTLFGRQGGGGLQGSFYDFKQDNNKKVTALGRFYASSKGQARVSALKREFRPLVSKKFSESSLSKLFKADTEMSFTHLVMGQTDANAAPQAFNVEGQVAPSGWMVVYQGEINPPKDGYYRFVGRYDDILIIYLNGKVVFDGSWIDYSGGFSSGANVPGPSLINVPMRSSQYLRMKRGDEIKIIVGESPGGLVGGGIFIQEKGKEYKKNSGGGPILPPFCTEPLNDSERDRLKALNYPIEVDDVPIFTVR